MLVLFNIKSVSITCRHDQFTLSNLGALYTLIEDNDDSHRTGGFGEQNERFNVSCT